MSYRRVRPEIRVASLWVVDLRTGDMVDWADNHAEMTRLAEEHEADPDFTFIAFDSDGYAIQDLTAEEVLTLGPSIHIDPQGNSFPTT